MTPAAKQASASTAGAAAPFIPAMLSVRLAYGEIWFGDRVAGEAILQRLIAANPKDGEALQLLGISRFVEAGAKPAEAQRLHVEANEFLARSYAARPDDYKTLYYYVTVREGEPGYPSASTVAAAARAFELAPQVTAVRGLYAEILIAKKDWDGARFVLLPMANDPHGGSSATYARKLLVKVDEAIAAPTKPAGGK